MRLDIAIFAIALTLGAFVFGTVIDSSFWLDETATALIASGSLKEAVFDTQPYPSHPPYYFIISIWQSIFGSSEISLRLPSLIASFHTAWLLVQISQLLKPTKSLFVRAIWITVSLIMNPLFLQISWQARPYALGLWFACAAIYALLLYVKYNSIGKLIISGLFSLLACLTSPFFAVLLGLQFIIALTWGYSSERARGLGNKITMMLIIVFIVWSILFVRIGIYDVSRVSSSYDFLPRVSGRALFVSMFQCVIDTTVVVCVVLLLLVGLVNFSKGRLLGIHSLIAQSQVRGTVMFISSWVLIPGLTLAAISFYYQAPFSFLARYRYLSVGGATLAIAMLREHFYGNRQKVLVTIAAVVMALAVCRGGLALRAEQWREAASYIKDELHGRKGFVFVGAGHPESYLAQQRMSEKQARVFTSPALVYGLAEKSQIHPLFPLGESSILTPYAQEILAKSVSNSNPVFLLLRAHRLEKDSFLISPYSRYYESHGYQLTSLKHFHAVTVVCFEDTRN